MALSEWEALRKTIKHQIEYDGLDKVWKTFKHQSEYDGLIRFLSGVMFIFVCVGQNWFFEWSCLFACGRVGQPSSVCN